MDIFLRFYGPYATTVLRVVVPAAVNDVRGLAIFLVNECDLTRRLHRYADPGQLQVTSFEEQLLAPDTHLAQFFAQNENSENHFLKILVPEGIGKQQLSLFWGVSFVCQYHRLYLVLPVKTVRQLLQLAAVAERRGLIPAQADGAQSVSSSSEGFVA